MTRLALGDRSAVHPVFDALWPLLKRFVSRQLPSSDADDVAQQALLAIFERAGELDPGLDGLSWALGIAAYQVKTARNRALRRGECGVEPVLVTADPRPSPEDTTIVADLERELKAVLGELKESDLATLTLLANGERLPGATFRKRVQRSVERLRAAWRNRHGPR